jgi:glutamate 5-kinase
VIASGRKPGVLTRILGGGDEGSFFAAKVMPKERRLRWMPFSERPLAELVLAEAGVRRLKAGKGHLYAADIRKVIGHFYAGDVVRLVDGRHNTFAKGVSRYSSEDCLRRRGQQLHEEVMILDDIAFRGSL